MSVENCLVFEDAPNGIDAAEAAGMRSVMVPDGNKVPPEMTLNASQLVYGLDDFDPEDFFSLRQ